MGIFKIAIIVGVVSNVLTQPIEFTDMAANLLRTDAIESTREIPLAYDVDVVVVGGSTRAVAAAVAAAESGAKVFLAAPRPYLGEDMCATYKLWLEEGETPSTNLQKSLFGDNAHHITTPMRVKRALDDALLNAKVDFLYGCYVTDILSDESGQLAGVVMTNRSGRQAVCAKVIIDATDRATTTRLTSATFAPYPTGMYTFSRIVIGGDPNKDAEFTGILYPVDAKNTTYQVYEYTLQLPMKDDTWASFANAEQQARNLTWQDGQAAASEVLFQVPPDPVKGRKQQTGDWPGADKIDMDVFRPKGIDGIYVLGGCADISRQAAAKLLRPIAGMTVGSRIGVAAAQQASTRNIGSLQKTAVSCQKTNLKSDIQITEMLDGLQSRPEIDAQRTVTSPAREIPIIGRYDVVVVGGGTGGAPAGIAATRGGAKTLVIEYLHGLGGVGTLGRINKYWHGNRVGFTAEIDKEVGTGELWNIEKKMEWFRCELIKAGGDLWFQSFGCGSVVHGKCFVGVVVATPCGRGVVLANTVIDATGNPVLPACAKVPCMEINSEHISAQGTGLPPYTPGQGYFNTDWTFNDDDDVVDMWRMFVVAKHKFAGAYDLGQLIGTRARRRIFGDNVITPMDIINQRLYPDVITVSKSNFDNHGFSSHILFMMTPPDGGEAILTGNVPYRALLPKGYDGILVVGLGISAHGDAMPVLRMQPDIQNQGYVAGYAASIAALDGATVRTIDVKKLQKHLVEKDIIPESMITAKDTYPISAEKMQRAVDQIADHYNGISWVLTNPPMALPMLRKAWRDTSDDAAKLRYAHVLGMLGDNTGIESLIGAIRASTWDKGWDFRGMGQFGPTTSPLDNLIIAVGRTGDKKGMPVVIDKLKQLTKASEFSHYRAVAIALENYRAPEATAPLAALLQQDGISGHAFLQINDVIRRSPGNSNDNTTRQASLRELILARALYRCGDYEKMAERILKQYAADMRGLYARHAKAILAEK